MGSMRWMLVVMHRLHLLLCLMLVRVMGVWWGRKSGGGLLNEGGCLGWRLRRLECGLFILTPSFVMNMIPLRARPRSFELPCHTESTSHNVYKAFAA